MGTANCVKFQHNSAFFLTSLGCLKVLTQKLQQTKKRKNTRCLSH